LQGQPQYSYLQGVGCVTDSKYGSSISTLQKIAQLQQLAAGKCLSCLITVATSTCVDMAQ
jgi:hypothetical protein